MRSMWKGSVTFGLVTIPVALYPAVEEHTVGLHQVHREDGGRIRYKRVCEIEDREVPYEEIARGAQDDAGHTAVLTDADMEQLPLPSKKTIDVLAFVDDAAIDPLRLDHGYYLAAESAAADKPYVLLRDAMTEYGRVAVTKVTLRTKESLALLRVHDDVMVLHTMYWPDEIREPRGLHPPEGVTVRPQEVRMATGLMESLSEGFDLESVHDEYARALERTIAAKLAGEKPPEAEEETTPATENVVDLMAALQASIDARAARETPGQAGPRRGAAKKSAPAKKPAAKKAPVKRAGRAG